MYRLPSFRVSKSIQLPFFQFRCIWIPPASRVIRGLTTTKEPEKNTIRNEISLCITPLRVKTVFDNNKNDLNGSLACFTLFKLGQLSRSGLRNEIKALNLIPIHELILSDFDSIPVESLCEAISGAAILRSTGRWLSDAFKNIIKNVDSLTIPQLCLLLESLSLFHVSIPHASKLTDVIIKKLVPAFKSEGPEKMNEIKDGASLVNIHDSVRVLTSLARLDLPHHTLLIEILKSIEKDTLLTDSSLSLNQFMNISHSMSTLKIRYNPITRHTASLLQKHLNITKQLDTMTIRTLLSLTDISNSIKNDIPAQIWVILEDILAPFQQQQRHKRYSTDDSPLNSTLSLGDLVNLLKIFAMKNEELDSYKGKRLTLLESAVITAFVSRVNSRSQKTEVEQSINCKSLLFPATIFHGKDGTFDKSVLQIASKNVDKLSFSLLAEWAQLSCESAQHERNESHNSKSRKIKKGGIHESNDVFGLSEQQDENKDEIISHTTLAENNFKTKLEFFLDALQKRVSSVSSPTMLMTGPIIKAVVAAYSSECVPSKSRTALLQTLKSNLEGKYEIGRNSQAHTVQIADLIKFANTVLPCLHLTGDASAKEWAQGISNSINFLLITSETRHNTWANMDAETLASILRLLRLSPRWRSMVDIWNQSITRLPAIFSILPEESELNWDLKNVQTSRIVDIAKLLTELNTSLAFFSGERSSKRLLRDQSLRTDVLQNFLNNFIVRGLRNILHAPIDNVPEEIVQNQVHLFEALLECAVEMSLLGLTLPKDLIDELYVSYNSTSSPSSLSSELWTPYSVIRLFFLEAEDEALPRMDPLISMLKSNPLECLTARDSILLLGALANRSALSISSSVETHHQDMDVFVKAIMQHVHDYLFTLKHEKGSNSVTSPQYLLHNVSSPLLSRLQLACAILHLTTLSDPNTVLSPILKLHRPDIFEPRHWVSRHPDILLGDDQDGAFKVRPIQLISNSELVHNILKAASIPHTSPDTIASLPNQKFAVGVVHAAARTFDSQNPIIVRILEETDFKRIGKYKNGKWEIRSHSQAWSNFLEISLNTKTVFITRDELMGRIYDDLKVKDDSGNNLRKMIEKRLADAGVQSFIEKENRMSFIDTDTKILFNIE